MFRRAINALPAWGWALLLIALPAFLRGAIALVQFQPDQPIGPADPDVWLRLTLVKQWLQDGGWYDHSYLSNAPHNAISPWTRPLDLVIALGAKLQWGDAALTTKLIRTAIVLPLVWMLLLGAGLLACVRAITPAPSACIMLAALLLVSPTMHNYFTAGNADHHAPLAALWAWVLYFMLTLQPGHWRMPLGAGLLLALMLWISPEALLIIAGCYSWLGICWLVGRHSARTLARLCTVTALATTAALMIERPPEQWFTPIYDSISIVHAVLLALCALAAWVLTMGPPVRPLPRACVTGALLGGIAAIMRQAFPLFFEGPMAQVHSYILTDFLPNIGEAQSLLIQHPVFITAMLIQPLTALGIAWMNSSRSDGIIPIIPATALMMLLCLTLAMYLVEMRWFYYLHPLVAVTLSPWLAAWLTPSNATLAYFWPAYKVRRLSETEQMFRRLPLLMLLLVLPLVLLLAEPERETKADKANSACLKDARMLITNGTIAALSNEPITLYAHTNLGGHLLFYTQHRIVASNYHREGPGIRDVWEGEKTTSDAALSTIFARRGIEAMLLCPGVAQPHAGVAAQLYSGTLELPWLTRLKLDTSKLGPTPPAIFLVKGADAAHSREK